MELKTIFKCIIMHLIKKYKASYTRPIKSGQFKFLLDWIYSHTKAIDNYPKLTIQTRICWIMHDYKDFPICAYCGKYIEKWFTKNIPVTHTYPKYCSKHAHCNEESKNKIKQTLANMPQEHWDNSLKKRKNTCLLNYGYEFVMQVPEFKDKSTQTFLTTYGVKRYSQLPEWKEKTIKANRQQYGVDWEPQSQHGHMSRIHTLQNRYGQNITCIFQIQSIKNIIVKKTYTKYKYNNILFDSSPELAFYIWLVDHNIKFLYHSYKHKFTYQLDGKTHTYYPDFYLIDYNKYIEIKGDQFFDENNNFINPYDLKHPEKLMQNMNV